MNDSRTNTNQNITLSTHPFYFAHYLNMARHNAYLILWEIRYRLTNKETPLNEETLDELKILKYDFGNKQPNLVDYRNRLLLKHFPFLNDGNDVSINRNEEICYKLKSALGLLNRMRNACSHVPFAEAYKAYSLEPYFDLAIERAEYRMQNFFETSDFDEHKNKSSKTYLLNQRDKFTLKGFCFFVNFFLEKKYAFQFLSGIKGFKDTREKKYRATLEVFTELCCRLPYPKLESSDFKLDMLNELSRCPALLFNRIDKDHQKRFITSEGDNVESKDTVPEYKEEEVQQTKMIRFGGRFPYFALRYFDQTELLGDIRFHINIGRWIKDSYSKERIPERKILKNVRTLGKLNNYSEDQVPDFWKTNNISIDDFDPFAPKYQLVENRIGISLKKPPATWPNPAEFDVRKKNIHAPDAILSTYELPNLFMYGLLYRQKDIYVSPSEYISSYINQIKEFINKVKSGDVEPVGDALLYKHSEQPQLEELQQRKEKLEIHLQKAGIQLNDLPDVVRYYLLGYKTKNKQQQAKRFFDKMLKKTERLQKRKEKIRVGDMAQELARDIVYLSPSFKYTDSKGGEHQHKLNDQEYDFLQKGLAYFYSYKPDIIELLTKHQLFTQLPNHPFLYRINLNKCQNLTDFFEIYLNQKVKWLNVVKAQVSKKVISANFFDRYDYLLNFEKELNDKEYFKSPLYLPRGIFNKPIINCFIRKGFGIKENDNIAFAIKKYLNESSQSFYNAKRYYDTNQLQPKELIAELKNQKSGLKEDDDKHIELSYAIKDIKNSENSIRQNQFTDRIMWLMLKDLFADDVNSIEITDNNFQLVGFDEKDNNFLKQELDMQEVLYKQFTICDKLPIKRYGEFRRFLKDRRLENLLNYFDTSVPIPRQRLVDELEAYDLGRMKILEKINLFETRVYKYHNKQLIKTEKNGHVYIEHKDYIKFVTEKYDIALPEFDADFKFKEFRNRTLHNQIIYKECIKNMIDTKSETLISVQILNIIDNVYDKMIEAVELQNV